MNIPIQHYVRDVRFFIGFQITQQLYDKALRHLKAGGSEILCGKLAVPFTVFENTLLIGAKGKAGVGMYVVRHINDPLWKVLTPEAFHREYAVQEAEPVIDAQGASAVPLMVPCFVTPACERTLDMVRSLLGITEAEAADFLIGIGLRYLKHLDDDDTLRNMELAEMDRELRKKEYHNLPQTLKQLL